MLKDAISSLQPISWFRRSGAGLGRYSWALGAAVAAIVVGALVETSLSQVVILLAAVTFAAAVTMRSPRTLLFVLAVWLMALGLLRRLLLGVGSHALLGDPLLLVEPAILVLLFMVAIRRGVVQKRSLLTKAVSALTLLAVIGAVNPFQGGLTVGLGGLLFVLVPMLAFWVGRALCDDTTMRRLFLLLGLGAVAAAVYGLSQTYLGFPSWDQRWIQSVTSDGSYVALDVGGVIRAFSSFSSSAEYASFLGVGIAFWFAWGRRLGRAPLMLGAMALIGTAIVLDSSRGIVVLSVVAIGVMAAAVAGVRPKSAALWGMAAVGLLFLGISHLAPQHVTGTGPAAALVRHQVGGLSQPFNAKDSTLGLHFQQLLAGLKSSVTVPIGHGTGSITLAASKFGGMAQGSEIDPSNAGTAFGLPGLVAYLVVAIAGLGAAYRVAALRRDWVAVATLGLLIVTLLQWLNGGQYAVAWLPWLALGWADRASADQQGEENGRNMLRITPLVEHGELLPSSKVRFATHPGLKVRRDACGEQEP